MYDIDRVKKEFYEACRKGGMTREIPVAFNGRLTRTNARVISNWRGNDLVPDRAEFSKQLIETATDNSIHEVILHEAAHAIVTELTREPHGHDAVSRECAASWVVPLTKQQVKLKDTPRLRVSMNSYALIVVSLEIIAECVEQLENLNIAVVRSVVLGV